jgi:hypothetical protein
MARSRQPASQGGMSKPSVASELEVALTYTTPSRPRRHWVIRTGEPNDYEEYDNVHRSIIELWEELQDGQIKDEDGFKKWVSQAKELRVSCVLQCPVRLLTPRTRSGTIRYG